MIESVINKCKVITFNKSYVFEVIKPSFVAKNSNELLNIIVKLINQKLVLQDSRLLIKSRLKEFVKKIEHETI